MANRKILTENILPFWLGDAIDRENGGSPLADWT